MSVSGKIGRVEFGQGYAKDACLMDITKLVQRAALEQVLRMRKLLPLKAKMDFIS